MNARSIRLVRTPHILATLFVFCALLLCTVPVLAQSDSGVFPGEDRVYCTQYGPLAVSFADGKAAGTYRILEHGDVGAFSGALSEFELMGEWIETDSRGAIRILFSSDWSSLEAAYTVIPDTEVWNTGWSGYMPPAGKSTSFELEGVTYRCQ